MPNDWVYARSFTYEPLKLFPYKKSQTWDFFLSFLSFLLKLWAGLSTDIVFWFHFLRTTHLFSLLYFLYCVFKRILPPNAFLKIVPPRHNVTSHNKPLYSLYLNTQIGSTGHNLGIKQKHCVKILPSTLSQSELSRWKTMQEHQPNKMEMNKTEHWGGPHYRVCIIKSNWRRIITVPIVLEGFQFPLSLLSDGSGISGKRWSERQIWERGSPL